VIAIRSGKQEMIKKLVKRAALGFGYDIQRIVAGTPRSSYKIEDYYPVHPQPRWGYGLASNVPIKAALEKGRRDYDRVLGEIESHRDVLHGIDHEQTSLNTMAPYWNNGWFSCLDAASLVGLLLSRKPTRYLEIGSGQSTLFARLAVSSGALRTTITSIDPYPRREVDAACDRMIRKPLEDCDLVLFDELKSGDILFFDGTHRVFTNSDVTVFFLEVLSKLKPGVLVHVHDIFLPDDYPPSLNNRYYSEQYLLGAMLLCGAPPFRVVLPNYFVCTDSALSEHVRRIFHAPNDDRDIPFLHQTQATPGSSFWFEMVPQ
jgi:hypothetical protein